MAGDGGMLAGPRLTHLLDNDLFAPVVAPGKDGLPQLRNYIGGRWVETGHVVAVDTPIDGSRIAWVPEASPEDVARAVVAADRANETRAIRDLPGHRRIELFERAAQMVREHQDVLKETLLLEAGKTGHDQQAEVHACADRMMATHLEASRIFGEYLPGDWSADTVGKMGLVIREPLGVIGCIGPFNYPLFIPTAKIVPALLAGNTIVAKPSVQTPLSLLLLARILEQAGLPPGTLNVVTGSGAATGEALVTDPHVRMVNFTGSTQVGKRIYAIGGLKRYHLELGGKGHALVLDDADVPQAAAKCVEGACKNSGQRCDAVSIAVVDQKVVAPFGEAAAKAARAWTIGDPRREGTRSGPLINDRAVERVMALVKDATDRGAKLLAGGGRKQRYVEPTVLADVTQDMRIAQEETFGPVLPIVTARNEEHALEIATRTRFGLDSCVFTASWDRMWRAAKRLQCGEVTLNDLPKHGVGHFPFGGQRESGLGREGIGYSIEEMTDLKTIVFRLGPRKAPA